MHKAGGLQETELISAPAPPSAPPPQPAFPTSQVQQPVAPGTAPGSALGVTAGDAAEAHSLAEIDSSLAADLDNLLQGDFESIDAVLDGAFEEEDEPRQGAVPQTNAAESSSEDAESSSAATTASGENLNEGDAPPAEFAAEALPAEDESDAISGSEAPAADSDEPDISAHDDQVHDEAASLNEADASAASVSDDAAAEADADMSSVREPRDESADLAAITPESAEEEAAQHDESSDALQELDSKHAPAAVAAQATHHAQPNARRQSAALHIVESTLRVASYPMQRMPATWRPVVNAVAVSMLLWVPAVWFAGPKLAQGSHEQHTIAEDAESHPPLHAESTITDSSHEARGSVSREDH